MTEEIAQEQEIDQPEEIEQTETVAKYAAPKYPKEGTSIRIVWEICDHLHSEGTAPTYKVVAPLLPAVPAIKDSTVRTQIQRWRMYMGLVVPRGPREEAPCEEPEEESAATA